MSQVTSPFLWRNQPSSLGLTAKTGPKPSLEPKRFHTYGVAKPSQEEGCFFCNDAEQARKAAL